MGDFDRNVLDSDYFLYLYGYSGISSVGFGYRNAFAGAFSGILRTAKKDESKQFFAGG